MKVKNEKKNPPRALTHLSFELPAWSLFTCHAFSNTCLSGVFIMCINYFFIGIAQGIAGRICCSLATSLEHHTGFTLNNSHNASTAMDPSHLGVWLNLSQKTIQKISIFSRYYFSQMGGVDFQAIQNAGPPKSQKHWGFFIATKIVEFKGIVVHLNPFRVHLHYSLEKTFKGTAVSLNAFPREN